MSDVKTGLQVVSPGVKIVKVKSRFATLALQDGGKSAAALIGAAENFLRAEHGRYQAWVAETLQGLDATLDDLPGSIPEALQLAYGQAAQIRDLGGTFGAPLVTEVADSLCELLYRLRSAGLYNSEAIAMHQSVLRLVCAADQSQTASGDTAALLAGLRKMVAKFPQPKPQPQAEPAAPAH